MILTDLHSIKFQYRAFNAYSTELACRRKTSKSTIEWFLIDEEIIKVETMLNDLKVLIKRKIHAAE